MGSQSMSTDGSKSWVENKQATIQGFEHLYNRYFPRLYAYIRYRVGRVQDAEDLVAETFLKVVQELDRFEWRGENAFSAWLFRIAHNLVSDFFRRSQRREETLAVEKLPQSRTANPTPDDVVL